MYVHTYGGHYPVCVNQLLVWWIQPMPPTETITTAKHPHLLLLLHYLVRGVNPDVPTLSLRSRDTYSPAGRAPCWCAPGSPRHHPVTPRRRAVPTVRAVPWVVSLCWLWEPLFAYFHITSYIASTVIILGLSWMVMGEAAPM